MTEELDKVLIVEDETAISRFLHRLFEGDWKRIDHATSAREGLEVIEREDNNYDLIILDMHLPDSQGLETLKLFNAASMCCKVGHTGDVELAEYIDSHAEELGMYGVIRKGSAPKHHLVDVIEKALARWENSRHRLALRVRREETERHRRQYLGR